MRKSALSDRILAGIRQSALAVAKFAGYNAAVPNRTTAQHGRYGTNPNSTVSQMQRTQLQWNGEYIVKNTSMGINLINKLQMYCGNPVYIPDTGDAKLDEAVSAYLDAEFLLTGVNCSMQEAFGRVANVEMPMRGDSALVWFNDGIRLKLMEVSADRIGELYVFTAAQQIDGLTYFAGIYSDRFGQNQAFKIYDRGYNDVYFNPETYPAHDVLFFKHSPFGGIRGITRFHAAADPIMKAAKILGYTMDTMAQQSKIAAISSNNSGMPDEADYEVAENYYGQTQLVENYADGAVVKYNFNGDAYQVLRAEHPSEAFIGGMEYCDQHGSLACGFPGEFLISPAKSGGAPSRYSFEAAGKEILRIRKSHTPHLQTISYVKIMEGVDKRILPAVPNITRGTWNWGTLPSADAFHDVQSDVLETRSGLTSRGRVIAANTGATFPQILRENTRESIAIEMAVQDANKELQAAGYEPKITRAQIAQDDDNPGATQQQGEDSGHKQRSDKGGHHNKAAI